MTPTDEPDFNDLHQARSELREGIENSRTLVRQTRALIELSECEGIAANDNEDWGLTN